MTDQKMIAAIFNDFMSLYRGTSQIGIQEICKKSPDADGTSCQFG